MASIENLARAKKVALCLFAQCAWLLAGVAVWIGATESASLGAELKATAEADDTTGAGALSKPPVVLISIDGLKPDHVLEADKHSLKVPNLRRLVAEGMHSTGVKGVMPTVTYPSHTTMVTGVCADKHGILTNSPFDPLAKNLGGWYWYAEDIRVPTLWDAAAKVGITTGSVDWPVTVGANITYNIAQYWRASTPDDLKIIRAVSTAGLLSEAERAVGEYPEGNDYTVAADRRRAAFNVYVLQKKRPQFHLCYFSGFDTEAHRSGPYSAQSLDVLEQIDELVGQVRAAAEQIGGGKAVICVVSDHGFATTDREINFNAAFVEAGLIKLNELGRAASWRAFAWYPSGSAGIMLKDPDDATTREQVLAVLNRISQQYPDAGLRIIEPPETEKLRGFPGAAYVVCIKPPFRLDGNLRGPAVQSPAKVGGTHGYAPDLVEMDASFFLAGPGIPAGQKLGRIDMCDIAPTLAEILGLELPTAEGHSVLGTAAAAERSR
jgi:predicted AlkP superfamily pyrophosphatase or phosphodiesterase